MRFHEYTQEEFVQALCDNDDATVSNRVIELRKSIAEVVTENLYGTRNVEAVQSLCQHAEQFANTIE